MRSSRMMAPTTMPGPRMRGMMTPAAEAAMTAGPPKGRIRGGKAGTKHAAGGRVGTTGSGNPSTNHCTNRGRNHC